MTVRICRYRKGSEVAAALYHDDTIVDLQRFNDQHGGGAPEAPVDWGNSLQFLPHGAHAAHVRALADYYEQLGPEVRSGLSQSTSSVDLLPPIPTPIKFFLLAGNYAEHIQEGGGEVAERSRTFPYVFLKPASTTLIGSGATIVLPSLSPDTIDWEAELAVVIGQRCKAVSAEQALDVVAGYTVVNDISNRQFRPNPGRDPRPKDGFFDWLHGKWFDSFAPSGPCVTSSADLPDPQTLRLQLKVNGETQQDSHTSKMIFGVAEVIEFISDFVTLEPGDLISTGTAAGVGSPRKKFLRHGDTVEAEIEGIGLVKNPVADEAAS